MNFNNKILCTITYKLILIINSSILKYYKQLETAQRLPKDCPASL